MVKIWKYFISDKRANVAVTFGVSAVVLAGLAGGAVDYSKKMTARNTLQGIADSAALSAAREFQLAGAKRPGIEAVAKSFIDTNMKKTSSRVKSTIAVSEKDATVDVTLSLSVSTPFMSLLGMGNKQVVTASSRARIFGGLPLCVLALEETEDKAIGAYSQARLTATGCSVYANSTDEKGIEAEGNARLNTGLTCSAGGARGGTANYTPAAVEDCPKVPDPLASRARPPFDGTCTFNDVEINGGIVPLSPGTYCGGLRINDDAVVVFQPGDYIIKDGPFEVNGHASAGGLNVGFFLTGDDARIRLNGESNIAFTGRESGPMSGLLFFEDPATNEHYTHQIMSKNVLKLEGTIYLPKSTLHIGGNPSNNLTGIAGESAYTVIIAKKLLLTSAPNLVLNTDYASSDVPLPESIARMSGHIVIDK